MAGPRILRAFAETYAEPVFVEIGANDGVQHDHLREHILERRWRGIMVEPVPYVFERLQRNYAGVPSVILENAAISDRDGELPFYYLAPPREDERERLPDWYDGIASFSREALLSHVANIPDLADRVIEAPIPALRFKSLLAKHGLERVELVVIDTEGFDWQIIQSIDLALQAPALLVYEHFHLSPDDRAACRAHLEAAGYRTLEEGFDTFCLHADADPRLARAYGNLRAAVPGVAKYEEAVR